jgi:hypothetical protein
VDQEHAFVIRGRGITARAEVACIKGVAVGLSHMPAGKVDGGRDISPTERKHHGATEHAKIDVIDPKSGTANI